MESHTVILNTKKKKAEFKNIMMINNKIYIFLVNSYVVVFDLKGKITKIVKLPSKLNSDLILIKDTMIFFDFKNKVSIIN